jgi:hypothetical protein
LRGLDQGQGRNNFIGAWERSNLGTHHSTDLSTTAHSGPEDTGSLWLLVPYPSIPPEDLYEKRPQLRPPFSEQEITDLNQLLGGIWTIPPDERLDLDFQQHLLRRLRSGIVLTEHVRRIHIKLGQLEANGRSLEITDFDDKNGQYTYRPFESASAADAEEWFLSIPPKFIKVSPDGFPRGVASSDNVDPRLMNPWKRTVYGPKRGR